MLAAVCMFGAIPYMPLIVSASEDIGIRTEYKEISGTKESLGTERTDAEETEIMESGTEDDGQKESSGQTEDEKEPDAEDAGQTKEPEKSETEDAEQTGEQETEDTEKTEDAEEAGETEDSENGETEDKGKTEMEEFATEESEEDLEESFMLLAEEAGGSVEEAVADGTYTDENGIIYHYHAYEDGTVNIYEMESYKAAYPNGKEINIPAYIDGYTVTQLTFTMSDSTRFPSVTIPETITYMGSDAFKFATINELYYNAEAASTDTFEDKGGSFTRAVIKELYIGENVKVIPDALFSGAEINLDELVLNVESIGEYAFYRYTTVTDLIIGENVKEIGMYAFASDKITNLHYNAVNAALKNNGTSGPFFLDTLSSITFGSEVESLPNHLFSSVTYSADTLDFPESLREIGEYTFGSSSINIGEVTIGENITSMKWRSFFGCRIGILNYNAIEAKTPGMTISYHHWNPFNTTRVQELRIGEQVRKLPEGLFYCVSLTQDELVIPESVISIGGDVLSCRGYAYNSTISIGKLVISENVESMGRGAFGQIAYDEVIVYASGKDKFEENYLPYKPVCGKVTIHGKSAYYDYFTTKTEADNITLLCEEFETTYGEEYYDEEKGVFVMSVTDSCVVCGYEKTSEEEKEACTVIFQDYDGRELSRQYVAVGSGADAPEVSGRTGYDFTGWDKSFTNVTMDITVTAQYKIKTFSVVFKDGSDIISEQKVAYAHDAKVPENPTRPEEEWGIWKFTGWDGNCQNVLQDEVLLALFEKVFNVYEVLFYDAKGNVLSRQSVAHGENAEVPDAPEKESTAQYSYTFTGWNGDTEGITGNTSFRPVYETATRSYTVTFVNGEETVSIQSVAYGGAADAPGEMPEKTGYDFTGWDKDFTNIVSDMTISAQYQIKSFYVAFKDKETIISKQKVEYGSNAILPQNPTRPEETWGTWKFTGWAGNYQSIKQDETLQAQFEKVLNVYEVLFYDAKGNVLSRQNVVHGEDAEIPDAPEKESTAQYSYIFTEWNGVTENITGNAAFHPIYNTQIRSYTVTFMDGDTVLDEQTILYGKAAKAPENPERAEEEWGRWEFAGWIGDYTDIAKDMIIRARFEKILHKYEVIFYDGDGNILSRQTVAHGQAAEAPEAPEKEPSKQYCYPFTGWDGDTTKITGDTEFCPVYGRENRTYTVTFLNGNAVFDTQKVEYGASAHTPAEPKKAADAKYSYHFTGWDGDYSFITGNTFLHALYEQKEISPEEAKKEEESGGGESSGENGKTESIPEDEKENPDTGAENGVGETMASGLETESRETLDTSTDRFAKEQISGIEMSAERTGEESVSDTDYGTETLTEIPEEAFRGGDAEDMENTETAQEEDIEDTEEESRGIPFLYWFIFLTGILILGFLFIRFLFLYLAERKVCGMILDESGCALCGIQLTLSGKDIMETEPDEDGYYCFDGLRKDDYSFNVYGGDGSQIFSADIRMESGNREEAFIIRSSDCNHVETNERRGKYEINLTV